MPKEYASEADRLRAYALKERAAVRKMRADGECKDDGKPSCYESCPHSYYCSELQYVLPTLSMF